MIEEFHFLRPWWLLSLLVPIVVLWLASRSGNITSQWKGMIAPHLLESLVVGGKRGSRIRPSWLLAIALALSTFAAAGPTWQREQPPFIENTAPLVIAVDLSSTMDAIDITPSRLERAKLKIRDIVASRGGARTAMIAYAGSAHMVLPQTEDASLIETYADALETRIMPVDGRDTTKALELADDMLSKENSSGTILFITDGVERMSFNAFGRKSENGLVVLGIGTTEGGLVKTTNGTFLTGPGGNRILAKLDLEGLKDLHALTGAEVATITDDDTDVRWIAQKIRTHFAQKQAKEGERWRDIGWWMVIPLAVLFGASFRKGWVVRAGVLLFGLRMLVPVDAEAAGLVDMWLTPDQQGRLAFERGDYGSAAAHFTDPMWKGVAHYRAGKFADAVDAFASVDTAESWYDQGNALLHLLKLEEAVTAYRKALEMRRGWPDAQANLAIAERLLKAKKEEEQEEQQPNEKPDQVQFDDKGKKGKEGELNIAEQTSEMWMKNIQVSPADLMARKFAIEAREGKP